MEPMVFRGCCVLVVWVFALSLKEILVQWHGKFVKRGGKCGILDLLAYLGACWGETSKRTFKGLAQMHG